MNDIALIIVVLVIAIGGLAGAAYLLERRHKAPADLAGKHAKEEHAGGPQDRHRQASGDNAGERAKEKHAGEPSQKSRKVFGDFDTTDFWDNNKWALEEYVGEPLTDALVVSIEKELGYKLPQAYIELMKLQNGGAPNFTNHRTQEPTSWAEDHVAITGIYGINRSKPSSLGGQFGSRFWIEERGYPPIGVYFCDCPSAGHDMICLDYRKCGPDGEPQVVHVDQELDYRITFVADSFEKFIRGLESDQVFE